MLGKRGGKKQLVADAKWVTPVKSNVGVPGTRKLKKRRRCGGEGVSGKITEREREE